MVRVSSAFVEWGALGIVDIARGALNMTNNITLLATWVIMDETNNSEVTLILDILLVVPKCSYPPQFIISWLISPSVFSSLLPPDRRCWLGVWPSFTAIPAVPASAVQTLSHGGDIVTDSQLDGDVTPWLGVTCPPLIWCLTPVISVTICPGAREHRNIIVRGVYAHGWGE